MAHRDAQQQQHHNKSRPQKKTNKNKIWPAATRIEDYTTNEDEEVWRRIDLQSFQVRYHVPDDDDSSSSDLIQMLEAAWERVQQRMRRMIPPPPPLHSRRRRNHPPPCDDDDDPHNNNKVRNQTVLPLRALNITITTTTTAHAQGNSHENSSMWMDESYELLIPSSSSSSEAATIVASLMAPTVYGALHGLQTFWQLVEFAGCCCSSSSSSSSSQDDKEENDNNNKCHKPIWLIRQTPLHISDAPAYFYRGLLVDTARHYLPVDFLMQNLDAMEWNKLNVLHWHLTDSQSWPYQSTAFPELAKEGAFCYPDCVYTAQDVQHVINQANLRGIHVVMELDLPGHSQAIGYSHPELMTDCDIHGHHVPREPLNATSEAVYDFVRTLYHEVAGLLLSSSSSTKKWNNNHSNHTDKSMLLPKMNPFSHIGGDEVSLQCWNESAQIQQWMKRHGMQDTLELLGYFEKRLLHIVTQELNQRAVVWQELFDDLKQRQRQGQGQQKGSSMTRHLSSSSSSSTLPRSTVVDVWMLNHVDSIQKAAAAGHDVVVSACWYLDHLEQNWDRLYQCDPVTLFPNLTQAEKARVIGGHGSMWGEMVDTTNFMSRVWPRTSAVAEKLWTGTVDAAFQTRQERLHEFRCRMVQQGIPASPVGPGYCGGRRRRKDSSNGGGSYD